MINLYNNYDIYFSKYDNHKEINNNLFHLVCNFGHLEIAKYIYEIILNYKII